MPNIRLALSDWTRTATGEPVLSMHNRFFEQNPTAVEQTALLCRPGLIRAFAVGDGPIRGIYTQSGVFNDDLFVVSGNLLYRVDKTFNAVQVGAIEPNDSFDVEMVATARFGDTSEYLFVADGTNLWVYIENGFARGTLNASSVANGDTVEIGGVYYQFTNGTVNVTGANGTSANPWRVRLGSGVTESFTNLAFALDAPLFGQPGVDYTNSTVANPQVTMVGVSGANMFVRARVAGPSGNSITTTETGANMSWGAGTLTGGGNPQLTRVVMPDNLGATSVDVLKNYVIVVPSQGPDEGVNGRWYYIEPGEIIVRPLNFFTAEKAPDRVQQVRVIGDQAWFFGQASTEVWYATGDENFAFAPVQGQVFDRGVWNGTAVKVKDAVVLVDLDGVVYEVSGNLRRVSTHAVEEHLSRAVREDLG